MTKLNKFFCVYTHHTCMVCIIHSFTCFVFGQSTICFSCLIVSVQCMSCVKSSRFFLPCIFYHLPLCFVPVRRVPPRFSIPPTNHEIMPGGSVNITCVAVGSPMPYVKWMLGAEDLTPEDDMPIGRNVLELNDVRQSANYTCVAMSTLGVIEAIAQITVKGMLSGSCLEDLGTLKSAD